MLWCKRLLKPFLILSQFISLSFPFPEMNLSLRLKSLCTVLENIFSLTAVLLMNYVSEAWWAFYPPPIDELMFQRDLWLLSTAAGNRKTPKQIHDELTGYSVNLIKQLLRILLGWILLNLTVFIISYPIFIIYCYCSPLFVCYLTYWKILFVKS